MHGEYSLLFGRLALASTSIRPFHLSYTTPDNYSENYIIGGRAEDIAQIAKSEKKADGAGVQLMKHKHLGTLVVDRVTVHSVSKLDTIGTAFEACFYCSAPD